MRLGVALTLWQLRIPSDEVGETSRRLLSDPDPLVGTAAFLVLVKRTLVTHDDFLLVLHRDDTAGIIEALQLPSAVFQPADNELATRLIELTRHSNANVQLLAMHRFRETGEAGLPFVSDLSHSLEGKGELHRLTAANTLGLIGADRKAYLPILTDLVLNTKDADIAWWSAMAIADSSPSDVTEVLPDLIKRLKQPDRKLQQLALAALMGFGDLAVPVVSPLIELLKSDETSVRTRAAIVLANIGPAGSQALPELMRCAAIELDMSDANQFDASRDTMSPPPSRRRRAGLEIPTLVQLSGPKAVSLWLQIREVDPTVAMIAALGRIGVGNKAASKLVIGGINCSSRDVRAAAATAIANMNCRSDEVLVALQLLINDESRTVRLNAARAIGRLGMISEVAELDEGELPHNAWLLEAAHKAHSESNSPSN